MDDDETFQVLPKSEKKEISEYVYPLQYLNKIKKLCDSNNAAFLCINLPSYATGETNWGNGEDLQKIWNGFSDYAESHNIPYINMLHHLDEIGVDFHSDFSDWRHLNYFGNQKITKYLGNYIKNNFDIPDHRHDTEYYDWNQNYLEFERFVDMVKQK